MDPNENEKKDYDAPMSFNGAQYKGASYQTWEKLKSFAHIVYIA